MSVDPPSERSAGQWRRAARQQAAVARLGQLGLRGGELDGLLAASLQSVTETLEVDTAVLFECLPDADQLRGRTLFFEGSAIAAEMATRLLLPAGRASMPGYTVLAGRALVSEDLYEDDRFTARAGEYGLTARSAVTAPVGWGERPWGVLAVYSAEPRSWEDDDVNFVQSVANTVGLAIARERVETELRDSSARLELSLGAGGLGAWTWDVRADEVTLSPSARTIFGLVTDTFDGSAEAFLQHVHHDDRLALRGDVYEALQTSRDPHNVFRVTKPEEGVRWLETWGRLIEEDGRPSRLVGVVSDVTERRSEDDRRDALLDAEKQARSAAEQARERLALLAEASERFNATLDPRRVLASIPELCIPLLADVCVVDLVEGADLVQMAAIGGSDQAQADLRALRAKRAELGWGTAPWSTREVARTGQPILRPELTDDEYRAVTVDEDHLALALRMGIRSVLVVALIARGRVLGVLSLLITTTDRRYDQDHLALAEQVASRVALAVDNGRLFESRNRVARSLQAALLPPTLPRIAGVALGARYQVAEGDLAIGGDFYDLMDLGGGSWGVVVGDVCGRGPDAAALTGLMRHSVRTAVVQEHEPSRVMVQTNDAVLDQIDDSSFCTAAFLRLDLPTVPGGDMAVRACSAGHPRPVVLRADGQVEFVECGGMLLGVMESPELIDVDVVLGRGDSIVLYTDGLTEARSGTDFFGDEGLVDTLATLAGSSSDEIASGLVRAVTEYRDGSRDDLAIVVVQVDQLRD